MVIENVYTNYKSRGNMWRHFNLTCVEISFCCNLQQFCCSCNSTFTPEFFYWLDNASHSVTQIFNLRKISFCPFHELSRNVPRNIYSCSRVSLFHSIFLRVYRSHTGHVPVCSCSTDLIIILVSKSKLSSSDGGCVWMRCYAVSSLLDWVDSRPPIIFAPVRIISNAWL